MHADWADRPSLTLHGEQAGKDRAVRPILRRLCTQASLLQLQPSDDRSQHPHDKTKAQQISRQALEPCLPCQSPPDKTGAEPAEELLFSWRPPARPSIRLRRLTTSLCAGVVAPNLAGAYSFDRERPAFSGIGWAPDRGLMAGLSDDQSEQPEVNVECQ